jgi:hypothetical protein
VALPLSITGKIGGALPRLVAVPAWPAVVGCSVGWQAASLRTLGVYRGLHGSTSATSIPKIGNRVHDQVRLTFSCFTRDCKPTCRSLTALAPEGRLLDVGLENETFPWIWAF